MLICYFLYQIKPEPASSRLTVSGGIAPEKGLKEMGQKLRCNVRPLVLYG